MPQETVRFVSDVVGVQGQIAGKCFNSRTVYNATANVLPYGALVIYSGTENNVVLPSATGQRPAGILYFERLYEDVKDANDQYGIAPKRLAKIVAQGNIWVRVEEAVGLNDPVYFRHTANGAGKDIIGSSFRKTADSATCDLLANARWIEGAAAGKLACLALNLA
jgi:hypothetical protein